MIISNINVEFGGNTASLFENGTANSINKFSSYEFKVFPNPVSSRVYVQFDLTESTTVNATLVNLLGETVKSNAYQLGAGAQNINFNMADVSSGIYFIELDINGQTTTQKITVAK